MEKGFRAPHYSFPSPYVRSEGPGNCPDGRDRITKHMLALSTYLGHSKVADTYWYLEATPDLMKDIADSCQRFFTGGRP